MTAAESSGARSADSSTGLGNVSSEDRYLSQTHSVENQPPALENYNLFEQDQALTEAVSRECVESAATALRDYGQWAGRRETIELGFVANENKPVFHSHDRFGHRTDKVTFHPAYHQLMTQAFEHGLHSSPWTQPGPGAQVTRAARYYMHSQVEAAHCCPITMTFASLPSIRNPQSAGSGRHLGAKNHRMPLRSPRYPR